EGRPRVQPAICILPGNTAFSRLSQPPRLSHDGVETGAEISQCDSIPVQCRHSLIPQRTLPHSLSPPHLQPSPDPPADADLGTGLETVMEVALIREFVAERGHFPGPRFWTSSRCGRGVRQF